MDPSSPRAPLHLLTGPAGSGKTQHALARVRDAATTAGERGSGARRGGAVLLVLPTYSQALHLERAALSRWDARAVLDAPFATFTSAGERFLPTFRVRALPSAEERDGLMAEALVQADVSAFADVRDRAGFRARLLRLVKEAKQSGEDPAAWRARLAQRIPETDLSVRERLEGFLAVFAAYDGLLGAAGLEDHEDALRRLLTTLEATPPVEPPRLLVVDGFDDFTPVEQAIVDALSSAVVAKDGEVLVTLPWDERRPDLFEASASARTHLLARGFTERALGAFRRADGDLAHVATSLFLPWGDPDGERRVPGAALSMVVAGDDEDEAEAVAREARRLMADGVLLGWRELGVIVRRLDEAGPRLAAAFDRLGVPVRLVGGGNPLALEGLVRAARGPLQVLAGATEAGHFEPSPLSAWLRWRGLAESCGTDAIDRLEIRWRRSGFPATYDAWRRAVADAGLDVESLEDHRVRVADARGAEAVYGELESALLTLLPLPPAGGLDGEGRPYDREADERRRRAAAARDRLVTALRGLARAAARSGVGRSVQGREGVQALDDVVAHALLAVPDRRLDAVSLLDAEEARFWELPVVFVAGLAQGIFPLRPVEDVLVRDDERRALAERDSALALPLASDRGVRERRLFYGALTRATRRVVLFRPGSSSDGDARAGSLFLRDLDRVVALDAVTRRRAAGRSAPHADECRTREDWALFAAARLRRGDDTERELARALVERGDATLLHRAARWRRADVDPLPEGARVPFGGAVTLVSATGLGAALACRHRFFLKSVARVPEDDVPFDGPAFGFRDEGTLLHEALRRALLDPDRAAADIVDDVLAWSEGAAGRDLNPLQGVARELKTRELVRVVKLFRARESDLASRLSPVPGGLERGFGEQGDVVLGTGEGAFALRGRIDRLDAVDGRALVIDYKRSPGSVKSASEAFLEGWDVQLPLYAAAVEKELDLEVVGFEWVAATARARRGWWSQGSGDLLEGRRESDKLQERPSEEFRELIEAAVTHSSEAVAALRRADHAKHVDADTCGRCAWRTVCRGAHGRSPSGGGA